MISGIVVSGVGLSPVYIAPITNSLLKSGTVEETFLYLGIFTLVGVPLLSLILRNPPADNRLSRRESRVTDPGHKNMAAGSEPLKNLEQHDYSWQKMIRTRSFMLLWVTYLMSAAAGLMLLGHLAGIASVQAKWQAGFILVVILSVFNAFGRIAGGIFSDKAGRVNSLFIVFLVQAANMFLFSYYQSIASLIGGAVIAGLAYGSLFALFPAVTAYFFGIRNLGVNYGLIFTGWGVAGIIGPVLGGIAADTTGSYNISFLVSGIMLVTGAVLVKFIKSPAAV